MRSIIFRGMLSVTIALTAACSSTDSVAPATARASADRTVAADVEGVNTVRRSVDQSVWVSCANGGAGEAVRVTGDLRYDLHLTTDATGVMHMNIKSNTSGLTAVGQTSGTFYRGLMSEHINSRAVDEMNMDLRTADIIRFVATGSRDAYSLMASTRIILDNGNYVVFDQTFDEVCR